MGGLTIVFRDGEAPEKPSENLAEKIAGDYSGYSSASCAMFEDMVTAGEELTVVANEDGTAKITMISSVWGTFNAESVAVAASGEDFTISGEGKVSMSMGGGDPKEYDFTVEGTISSDKKVEITYVCPAVMGGLTIVFRDGEAPVAE